MSLSSSPDQSNSIPKSSYPPLEKPNFTPSVPSFLLENLTDQDKYIIEQISLVNQYTQWAVTTEMSTHEQVLKTNGRVLAAEKHVKDLQEKVQSLESKANVMAPFVRPMTQFAGLWEYSLFRWAFWVVLFFLFTYALPWYLAHPLDISQFFKLLLPTP